MRALSGYLTQSLARKKAPKRIPNSIATNWEIASFRGVESIARNTLYPYINTRSGIYDDQRTGVLRNTHQLFRANAPATIDTCICMKYVSVLITTHILTGNKD